jgi:hypothetical protein
VVIRSSDGFFWPNRFKTKNSCQCTFNHGLELANIQKPIYVWTLSNENKSSGKQLTVFVLRWRWQRKTFEYNELDHDNFRSKIVSAGVHWGPNEGLQNATTTTYRRNVPLSLTSTVLVMGTSIKVVKLLKSKLSKIYVCSKQVEIKDWFERGETKIEFR